MMEKFTIHLAIFAAFLLLVDASIYRTTVIIDEKNPRESRKSCQQQFQEQQNLRQCQEYIREESRLSGEDDVNPQEEQLRQCCEELQELENRCRCEGLQMAIEQQRQQAGLQGQEIREAFDTARSVPSRCQLSPGHCRFSRSGWF